MPGPVRRPGGTGGPGQGALAHDVVEAAARGDGVDEAPVERLLALDALGPGGEDVGEVAAHVALVDDARQAAGAGQHGQQRHLGQRDGRRAVVDEDDLVAGQGQLVAAAGGRAVDGGDPDLAGVGRGVLDRVARLVRELAEADLVGVRRAGEHLDVGAGAEDLVEAARDDDAAHLGVLEAQPLDGVVELDVDAEVVAVELQLVVVAQPGLRRDPQRERGDRGVDRQLPVAVRRRLGVERDVLGRRSSARLDGRPPSARRYVKTLSNIYTLCNVVDVKSRCQNVRPVRPRATSRRPRLPRTSGSRRGTRRRGARRTGRAPARPGQWAGSRRVGMPGSRNGKRRHSWTRSTRSAQRAASVRGARSWKSVTKLVYDAASVSRSQALAQEVVGGDEVARLGPEDHRPGEQAEVAEHGVGGGLPIEVRGDGDAGGDEAEAGELELRAQLVALRALVLGHGAQHDEPAAVPAVLAGAEGVDPGSCRRRATGARRRSGASGPAGPASPSAPCPARRGGRSPAGRCAPRRRAGRAPARRSTSRPPRRGAARARRGP